MKQVDVVIIGGGMVGAATALGLAKQKKQVILVEGQAPEAFHPEQAIDLRVSAVSLTSINLLKQLGAWGTIESMRALAYTGLETWESPNCKTAFHASELDLPHLGYMIENRVLQLGLWAQFEAYENLQVIAPDRLESLEFFADHNKVTLASGLEFSTQWVIGADGVNSQVRQLANIGITSWDYRQHCMLINIALPSDTEAQSTTWQEFTPSGPRAFLPMPPKITDSGIEYQGSLVWYDSPQRIQQLQKLSNEQLQQEVRKHFPSQLNDFVVLNKGSFPLTRRHAQRYIANRCILVGDSAHTINPLAGQGVNLGFKDVYALLEVIADKGLQDEAMLASYEKARRADNLIMQTGMDVFYKTFSNDVLPVKFVRNAVLKFANNSGVIKKQALKYALGL